MNYDEARHHLLGLDVEDNDRVMDKDVEAIAIVFDATRWRTPVEGEWKELPEAGQQILVVTYAPPGGDSEDCYEHAHFERGTVNTAEGSYLLQQFDGWLPIHDVKGERL